MSPNHDATFTPPLNRRNFASAAVLSAISAAAATTSPAHADDPKPEEKITLAKAVEFVVRQRFGEHLSDEQIKKVVSRAQNYLVSRSQRQPNIKNSDEPAFVFQADI